MKILESLWHVMVAKSVAHAVLTNDALQVTKVNPSVETNNNNIFLVLWGNDLLLLTAWPFLVEGCSWNTHDHLLAGQIFNIDYDLIKPKVHRQPNIRFFAYKRLSWVWPYLTNQAFNLIGLTETSMHLPCASLAGLPSWPDYRIFNQVTNACTSGIFFFSIWC